MLLQIADVSKCFNGVTALSGVSLEVCAGEAVGVIGPNGSGKTTLFNAISGFVMLDSGKIYFEGHDLLRLPAYKIRAKGIARTFQLAQLCSSLTIIENISVGAYHSSKNDSIFSLAKVFSRWTKTVVVESVMNAASFMELTDHLDAFPDTLTNFERRKAEVARALVSSPKLLLLDEPTSGFTQSERDLFTDIVQKISSLGISTLIIEHDLALIRKVCSKVLVLDAGQKVAEGAPDMVSRDSAVAEIYVGVLNASD